VGRGGCVGSRCTDDDGGFAAMGVGVDDACLTGCGAMETVAGCTKECADMIEGTDGGGAITDGAGAICCPGARAAKAIVVGAASCAGAYCCTSAGC
jgi:hypothetical protein